MSRLQKEAIYRICAQKETTALALELLGTASLCTGPGTGYDLREGASGLPAVCAFLASEELGYGEVSAKVAQAASCLAPKVWQATLKTVRSALESVSAPPEEEEVGSLDYEDLIKENHVGRVEFVAACMRDVEKALLKSGQLPEEFLPIGVTVKVVIFAWVSVNVMKLKQVSPEAVIKDYDVPKRDYEDICEIITSSCQDAIQRARQKVEDLRARSIASSKASRKTPAQRTAAASTTTGASPSKPSAATASSPSKPSAAATGDRNAPPSPHKTPTRKRKVEFAELEEVDYDLLDTPSKRPRTSPTKSRTATPAAPTSTHAPNPDAVSPLKRSRPPGAPPPPLPALAMPKPSIFPSTKRAAAAPSPLELLAQRSSSRPPPPSASPARTTRAQARSQLAQEPSTPRRRGRPPKNGTPAALAATPTRTATPAKGAGTPAQRRVPAALAALDEEEEEARRPRRFRPVFLDQRQWFARDPRVEREWRMVEERMREARGRDVVRSC